MSDHASDNKNYPLATEQVAHMMGLSSSSSSEELSSAPDIGHGSLPVANLPVVDTHEQTSSHPVGPVETKPHATNFVPTKLEQVVHRAAHFSDEPQASSSFTKILKTVFPYILVFGLGIFLYFFFFTNVNFGSLFKASTPTKTVQDTALQALEKQNLSAYNTWIKSYYYDVSNPAVLDPETDNSGNGLTNFQKFLLNLNPKSYDTLGLGMADSEALSNGINPASGQPLNDNQKQILSKYFDMEIIMNKLALNKKNGVVGNGSVAGASIFGASPALAQTISANPTPTPTPQADANVVNGNDLDINTSVAGRLQIPSLKIDAPLIFSKSTDDFDKDLLNGVIHYPGTALPGQIGTSYISGHSSNYVWVKSNYNHIFTHLDGLGQNQSFTITVTLNSGKKATLHYVVVDQEQYSPADQAQFASNGKSVVALSTCWPVGSTAKRLVVFGELTQVEQ